MYFDALSDSGVNEVLGDRRMAFERPVQGKILLTAQGAVRRFQRQSQYCQGSLNCTVIFVRMATGLPLSWKGV